MDDPERMLVIILASALAVFLLLAIVAAVKVIQLVNNLKVISEKAEKLADKAEHITDLFKFTAGPVAIGRLLSNVTETVMHHHKKSKGSK